MTRKLLSWAGALAVASLGVMPAVASPVTTFVSVTGADEGTCATSARPCRTFVYAYAQTSRHGEIFALTPGNYGPVRITKPISITGVEGAGIFDDSARSSPIEVVAGDSDVIYVTGLTLDKRGGEYGLKVSRGSVRIRKCTIQNTVVSGILISDGGVALIEDTSVPSGGIYLRGASSLLHRVVSSAAEGTAIDMESGRTTLSETSAAGSRDGIVVWAGKLFMTRSAVTGNSQRGVVEEISWPGDPVFISSGGDNLIRGNATDVVGIIPNIGKQ
jgi:hypothetical protein